MIINYNIHIVGYLVVYRTWVINNYITCISLHSLMILPAVSGVSAYNNLYNENPPTLFMRRYYSARNGYFCLGVITFLYLLRGSKIIFYFLEYNLKKLF